MATLLEAETEASPVHAPACERCGTYAELTPVRGRELCEECRGRLHPIAAQPFTVDALFGGMFTLLWQLGWRVPALVMLADLPWALAWVLSIQHTSDAVGKLAGLGFVVVFGPIADVALVYLAVKHVHGTELSLADALKIALVRLPFTIVTSAMVLLALFTSLLFCILPALVVGPALSIASATAGLEGVGPVEAIRRSWQRTKGYRVQIFVVSFVANLLGKGSDWAFGLAEQWFWNLAFWGEMSTETWELTSNIMVFSMTLILYQIAWLPARMIPPTVYVKLSKS